MGIILTRVAFCERCYKNEMPKTGHRFLTIGSKKRFSIHTANQNGKRGFTPHIIELIKVEKKMVTYAHYCAMENCGYLIYEQKDSKLYFEIIHVASSTISIADWNSLVQYRDETYRLD